MTDEPVAPPVLVSACLRGVPCRFDGRDKALRGVDEALAGREVVAFCPEQAGGLGTPRAAAELVGGDGYDVLDGRARVVDVNGVDVTEAFVAGARRALAAARRAGCAEAVLMPRSPSCGRGEVYDGEFRGVLVPGDGVTAALLERNGAGAQSWSASPVTAALSAARQRASAWRVVSGRR